MESLLFIIDSVVIVVLVFTSVRNDKLRPGIPQSGFFRFKAALDKKAAPAAKNARFRR